ncbi:MAG: hypothetical protein RJA81_1315, partial [Planctomycetota bacterium]
FLMMVLISSGFSTANLAYSRGLPIGSFVMPFNKSLWTSPSSYQYVRGDITTRQKMLGSVVQILLRDGNRQSIIANLGPPENNGFFATSGCDYIYRTGPQRDSIFPIDDEWLLIWFDSNGNTLRYEISSD